jgi:signal transduction histidine kinase
MTRRRTATIVFIVLCVVLVSAALSLNIGWIIANGQRVAPLVLGVLTFALIIAGLIVYTVFLVREMGITEQQDSFLNSVTHELKTPIASIRLYLETLQSREVGDAQRAEFYQIMLSDTDRLQHTVEQVLKAGYARQRHRLLHTSPVDLPALALECVEIARRRHHLDAEDIALSGAGDAEAAITVNGDVDELRTALLNLLDNAVKYSSGRPRVTVQVAAPGPDTAWIRVKDAGVGIPRAQLSRIFNRFYRFQSRGFKVKGTGLGLYIVRSIAKQHYGRVFAASEGEGKGATFTLELPRMREPALSDSRGSGVERPALSDPRRSGVEK